LFEAAVWLHRFSHGAANAKARADEIRLTVEIADWPPAAAEALIAAQVEPRRVAEMFSLALRRVQ
jgi:hypothetical protein